MNEIELRQWAFEQALACVKDPSANSAEIFVIAEAILVWAKTPPHVSSSQWMQEKIQRDQRKIAAAAQHRPDVSDNSWGR